MSDEGADQGSRGIGFGLAAYGLWGAVPLFWPLVAQAGSLEILAHRIVWSFVISVVLVLFAVRRGFWTRMGNRRSLLLLGAAAAIVSVNWGTYIWSVNHGHVVETALGYYINPILSIVLGVVVLREKLSRAQWASLGLAVAAVVVLTVDYGTLPWIALVLAVSFATYGFIKNRLGAGAVDSLAVESALLTPVALVYLGFLEVTGRATFGHLGWGFSLLLVATGLVTLVPLLFFAGAATRLPLSTLGLLQYLAPTLQFVLGITYFGESMSTGRWVGFGLVWLALIVMTADGLLRARRNRATSRQAQAEPAAV
ncbi:EamA family transporter RarD [Microlunatus flavus]|uniref:Chloramphenicol-sensitive protein RarD n=1 Tax=Microlunatus flavus TaxID=1036181 RepID=A0A1H9LVC9_9ACTN|nr:EamA family transporter RarD [Microlunatus flavus]SER15308.1 chloramphenicol-sensitive protein RarD [Microlunatus flavus]